jgi:hypothetical protein
LKISQHMKASQMVMGSPGRNSSPVTIAVFLLRRNIAGCGENVPCYKFPVVCKIAHSQLICGARMRSIKTTMTGQVDGHHSLPGACSRLFSRSQSYKRFGGDAAGSRLFGRKNRRPLLSRDAIALPPLGYGGLAHGNIGREVFQRRPQTDNVTEGAEISHRRSLRTIGPKTQGQTGLRLRKMFRTSCPHD